MKMDGFTEKSSSANEEKGNALFAEDFQVEDLLDLRGLPEPDRDDDKEDVAAKGVDFSAFDEEAAFHISDISLPEETEAAYLEWLSCFLDECHSEYPPACAATMAEKPTACIPLKKTTLLSSPAASVFINPNKSTAASAGNINRSLIPKKGKRSKRLRRLVWLWSLPGTSPVSSLTTVLISSSSPSCSCSSSSPYISYEPPYYCSCSSSSSNISYEPPQSPSNVYMPKKRGRKPKISVASIAFGERRCMHCGVQKTPQWRAGPHGPKTLCNACGVRFKSGRLLPEYRPACSPTFVTSVHSNSHRKVLEMRRRKEVQLFSAAAPPVESC